MQYDIIGTGTWGAACACVIARKHPNHDIILVGRQQDKCRQMQESRQHPLLSNVRLPDNIRVTSDAAHIRTQSLLFWAVPTQHSAAMARQLKNAVPDTCPLVSLSKGLEQDSHARISEILQREWGPQHDFAVLSGPSHAEEVGQGLPAGLVCAAAQDSLSSAVVEACHQQNFRVYTSNDVIGVEMGGALKNVIAIAAGISDGMQLGDNIKATLVTRGLAEMRRLGRVLGAEDQTFAGLAGIGDLLTTCYSAHGRNRALGERIGRGEEAREVLASSNMVAEGAWTSSAVAALAAKHAIDMPVAEQVTAVLWDKKPLQEAIEDLLSRAAKEENA